uniref:Uncharacterized protein n=1 Tax=Romanomermis culicivorax TaxID=13658 RepID=A0A915JEK1_ROMCU
MPQTAFSLNSVSSSRWTKEERWYREMEKCLSDFLAAFIMPPLEPDLHDFLGGIASIWLIK